MKNKNLSSNVFAIVFNENRIKVYAKEQKLYGLLKIAIGNLPVDRDNLLDMINNK